MLYQKKGFIKGNALLKERLNCKRGFTVCRKVSHGNVFNVFVQIVCIVQVVCNICMSELSALSILSALSALSALSVWSIVSRFEFDENCDVEKSVLCYLWAQEVCP